MLGHSIFIQSSVLLSSVNHLCLTPCNCMNHSTPGLPFHHQLPEFTQTHVHWVGDDIQPSHPLSSPSPPAPNPSQHQSFFGIDHLVISMCRVFSCVVGREFAMTSVFSWQNSISLCPTSFYIPRPNVPVTPGVSWLPTFSFQFPIMKRTSFLDVSSRRCCWSS